MKPSTQAPIVLAALVMVGPASAQQPAVDENSSYDSEHPAAGYWTGHLNLAEQEPAFAVFDIAPDGAGWSVKATALLAFAIQTPCVDIRIDGRDVAFTLKTMSMELRLDGEVSDDGQRLTGNLAGKEEAQQGSFELGRTIPADAVAGARELRGAIQMPGGAELDLHMTVAQTPEGSWVAQIEIPAQGVRRFPLTEVKVEDGRFSARLPSPTPAHIAGEFDLEARSFSGTMTQGGMSLPMKLSADGDVDLTRPHRPQHPEPPFPYETREITVEHPDGHRLAGTLTIPDREQFGAGPFPAAILISGSGQQDRDETLAGHKPFLVMSDYLTRRGIAVMRYDDRGVGESTGIESVGAATSEDFASDTLAVLEHLRTIEAVDRGRTGLIGHSEGAVIAALVGRETDDLAFVVLLAGPGVPGRELLPLQLSKSITAQGASEAQANALQEHVRNAMDLIEAEAGKAELEAELEAAAAITAAATALTDPAQVRMIKAQYQVLLGNPWMSFFSSYDPRADYVGLGCPILACNGTLDLQVWHEQNLDAIEQAVREAGGVITVKRYEGLNHLFQPASTGSGLEYAQIETTFEDRVLEDIAAWIREVTGTEVTR